MKRCYFCGFEIIRCPSGCTFLGWKHQQDGRHACPDYPARYYPKPRRYFAWGGTK